MRRQTVPRAMGCQWGAVWFLFSSLRKRKIEKFMWQSYGCCPIVSADAGGKYESPSSALENYRRIPDLVWMPIWKGSALTLGSSSSWERVSLRGLRVRKGIKTVETVCEVLPHCSYSLETGYNLVNRRRKEKTNLESINNYNTWYLQTLTVLNTWHLIVLKSSVM